MLPTKKLQRLSLAAGIVFIATGAQAVAGEIFVTGWVTGLSTGGNNIYTNLNQEFPNTGSGTPGSGIGQDNSSFIFNPATYSAANSVPLTTPITNGITFELLSNSTGQDFEQIAPSQSGSTSNLDITTINGTSALNVAGVADVYLLVSAYFGTSYNVTFTGTGGATQTFSNVGVQDFCNGTQENSTSSGAIVQSAVEVDYKGACGTGNSNTGPTTDQQLYEDSFALNSSFTGHALTGIDVTSNGDTTLLLGVTAAGPTIGSGAAPEPSSIALFGFGLAAVGFLKRRANVGRSQ